MRLAFDRLLGQADESAVFVLSTPVGGDEDLARDRLRAFLAAHAPQIEGSLEVLAQGRPE